ADTFTRREADDDGMEQEVEVPFLKSYTVFNAEQIDGLPAHYHARAEQPAHPVQRIERADRFVAHTRADLPHGAGLAYYAASGASWLKVLRNDNRAVFTAAAHAQRAADFLHGLQANSMEAAA